MIPVPHITAATPHMLYNDPIQNNYPQIQTKLIPFPPVQRIQFQNNQDLNLPIYNQHINNQPNYLNDPLIQQAQQTNLQSQSDLIKLQKESQHKKQSEQQELFQKNYENPLSYIQQQPSQQQLLHQQEQQQSEFQKQLENQVLQQQLQLKQSNIQQQNSNLIDQQQQLLLQRQKLQERQQQYSQVFQQPSQTIIEYPKQVVLQQPQQILLQSQPQAIIQQQPSQIVLQQQPIQTIVQQPQILQQVQVPQYTFQVEQKQQHQVAQLDSQIPTGQFDQQHQPSFITYEPQVPLQVVQPVLNIVPQLHFQSQYTPQVQHVTQHQKIQDPQINHRLQQYIQQKPYSNSEYFQDIESFEVIRIQANRIMNLEEKSEILLKEIDRQYELLTLRDQDISYWESYYISLENNRRQAMDQQAERDTSKVQLRLVQQTDEQFAYEKSLKRQMRELNEQNYDISYWKENSSTNENELMEMKRLEKQYEYLVNDNSKLNQQIIINNYESKYQTSFEGNDLAQLKNDLQRTRKIPLQQQQPQKTPLQQSSNRIPIQQQQQQAQQAKQKQKEEKDPYTYKVEKKTIRLED